MGEPENCCGGTLKYYIMKKKGNLRKNEALKEIIYRSILSG